MTFQISLFLALTAYILQSSSALITHRSAAEIAECIAKYSPDATVYGQSDNAFYQSYIGTNLAFEDEKPELVVIVTSVEDIKAGVKCAIELGEEVVVRNGGHSFAGYSYTSGIMLNLDAYNAIDFNRVSNEVTVQSGNRLGRVYGALIEESERSGNTQVVGAGTCPTVGASGHTLCAGWGMFGRKVGYIGDQIASIDLVNATGELITVSETANKDLFYALRGGCSSSFGFIESITFRMTTLDTDRFVYIDTRVYDIDNVVRVGNWFQQYGPEDAPPELTIQWTFGIGGGVPYGRIRGLFLGSATVAKKELLADWEAGFDGIYNQSEVEDMFVEYDYLGAVNEFTGLASNGGPYSALELMATDELDRETVFYKNSYLQFEVINDRQAYVKIFNHFEDGNLDFLQWKCMGGAVDIRDGKEMGSVDRWDQRSPVIRGQRIQTHYGLTAKSWQDYEDVKARVTLAEQDLVPDWVSGDLWRYPGYLVREYSDNATGPEYFGAENTVKLAVIRRTADPEGTLLALSAKDLYKAT
ncbi:hypothetical protein SARC_10024 [Sphaeroforma arctica JP610]|uniref:FAD-binding PCMH-type domain-containing protein n=1 Tax=Sphaeroforma arctica JP610 TaxID=667725 RepID=A0A0L0FM06_9EUKA|nr:hypothetical protein SARC_10024 [Sphaeroforma arctica JP610]KNC77511.1 hypothetical protein SARC_10024 [Sphaeroforma arctica JP610]|eukprot:XP_014151413.1 hypothetical protein SARC_10024 [Sphaeroforma arctica JP610]